MESFSIINSCAWRQEFSGDNTFFPNFCPASVRLCTAAHGGNASVAPGRQWTGELGSPYKTLYYTCHYISRVGRWHKSFDPQERSEFTDLNRSSSKTDSQVIGQQKAIHVPQLAKGEDWLNCQISGKKAEQQTSLVRHCVSKMPLLESWTTAINSNRF